MNILLGVTGGIAAYKSADLASRLVKKGHSVDVVMTEAAARFVAPLTFETLTKNKVCVDMFDKKSVWEVEHIALAKKADIAVLAPATANTVAKLAAGIADNMLTTVFLALECPVVIAPAMNTGMLDNMATLVNMQILRDRGIHLLGTGEGRLACGDVGAGRMAEPAEIVRYIEALLKNGSALKGRRVLVTAGPTREAIDPVRYITNRSSGRMGYALAGEAKNMGADVTLVTGPTGIAVPYGVRAVRVENAQDMYSAVMENRAGQDIIIACAAVADYKPKKYASHKLKKQELLVLELVKTKDILAELGKDKSCYLVGFAAETDDLEKYAEDKLKRKNLDMIVANDVSSKDTGFDSEFNAVTIIKRDGTKKVADRATKRSIASVILREAAEDLGSR
jgi:phosphopantothenoylcysteine decarboxylase/phosphopantothenate--cysteine ligase